MNLSYIARVCHEANRAYCASIGDHSLFSWGESPEWQKASVVSGVRHIIGNPDATPEDSHINWLKDKEADGWTYGETKDPINKKHPCIVPYDQLPAEQKAKDYIFHAIVKAMVTS